ncbi:MULTISPECIES: DUF1330 domain-containing protein [Burkholderiaceae]|jgi:uncharacterized protein (DUF1330 family)|uniref:DUF1330 domain-containing protein n=2 Tax=Paraburkholderia TaxID=1822464 RepID=Q13UN2_PARXL|nr:MULTISPECIES: DUF1330 domain-containing protein [Burkholderiaceae]ABE32207.1 Conserved hypothetical protein [Paraburkholderia xenovorans LB400]AIP29676.1 hypothetical protein DR64_2895 [Paraburkholderia xenovorans LB400]ASV98254.1 DUF1330 domain-containing protein [Paraburkholderia aromaticivorans]NPT33547.1 DUF1330 domain-containing protein [Paraburkholderia xenovorans]SED89950.1 Uncharacterized conserved protein, DUF1330 family [Burkholderia sp. WP9]
MPAYVVITREKTLDPAKLEEYKQVAPATFEQHPVMMLASHGRREVVEGPAIEDILILEFTSYDEALAWYHSPEYQAVSDTRLQGADYRIIITEGLPVM